MADKLASLIEQYSLGKEFDNQVTDVDLERISRSCCGCGKWKCLSPHLGMKPIKGDDIGLSASKEDEKRLEYFRMWKQSKGSDATYRNLVGALLEIECVDDAEKVCLLVKNNATSASTSQDPADTHIHQPEPDQNTGKEFGIHSYIAK